MRFERLNVVKYTHDESVAQRLRRQGYTEVDEPGVEPEAHIEPEPPVNPDPPAEPEPAVEPEPPVEPKAPRTRKPPGGESGLISEE